MSAMVQTTDLNSVYGDKAYAELSGLQIEIVGGAGRPATIITPGKQFFLELEMEYLGDLRPYLPPQDIEVTWFLELLGEEPNPAPTVVTLNGQAVFPESEIVVNSAVYNTAAAPLVGGIYRVAASVRSSNSTSCGGQTIMTGFIEGLVFEVSTR